MASHLKYTTVVTTSLGGWHQECFWVFPVGEVVSFSSPPLHPVSLFHVPSLKDNRDSFTSFSKPSSKLPTGNAARFKKQIKWTVSVRKGKAKGTGNKGNHQERNWKLQNMLPDQEKQDCSVCGLQVAGELAWENRQSLCILDGVRKTPELQVIFWQ